MKYVRITIYALVFVLAVVFIQQNLEYFAQDITIRLNLHYFRFSSMPIPIYVLLLLSFLAGVIIASLYGVMDRIRTKSRLRSECRERARLQKELESLKPSEAAVVKSVDTPSVPSESGSSPRALELRTETETDKKDQVD